MGLSYEELRHQVRQEGMSDADRFRQQLAAKRQARLNQQSGTKPDDAVQAQPFEETSAGEEEQVLPVQEPESEEDASDGADGEKEAPGAETDVSTEPETKAESEPESEPEQAPEPEPAKSLSAVISADNDSDIMDFMNSVNTSDIIDVPPMAAPMPKEKEPEPEPEEGDSSEEPKKEAFTRPKQYSQLSTRLQPKGNPSEPGDYQKSTIKNVPTSLVQYIRRYFPVDINQSDALAAYIYAKEGYPSDVYVPDSIKKLAEQYKPDSLTNEEMQANLASGISDIKTEIKKLKSQLDAIEVGVVYNLFDRIGFRKKKNNDLATIELLESGMKDFTMKVETAGRNLRSLINTQNGRRIQ